MVLPGGERVWRRSAVESIVGEVAGVGALLLSKHHTGSIE